MNKNIYFFLTNPKSNITFEDLKILNLASCDKFDLRLLELFIHKLKPLNDQHISTDLLIDILSFSYFIFLLTSFPLFLYIQLIIFFGMYFVYQL